MDLEAGVEQLLAHEAIRQLVYRYAIAVDSRDVETITSLYVADVKVGNGARGRDAMYEVFDEMLTTMGRSILNVGNHLIELDGADRARGTVYCRAELEMGDEWVVQQIVYHDKYERHDGDWLFRSRRHLLFYGADMLRRPIGLELADAAEFTTGRGSMPEYWPTFREFQKRHGLVGER
ncbi:MAG: hypothetical protein JWN46_2849 [Acidimicrobiales bacterium]|nr:hypothetical protein [Acidimicrobiales bacterium]